MDTNFCIVSWYSSTKAKEFFEKYAKEHFFDPLSPANWYMQSEDILAFTVNSFALCLKKPLLIVTIEGEWNLFYE